MILGLLVCGKLKAGPETDLVREYLSRAKRQGRNLGITHIPCREIALSANSTKRQAADLAIKALPAGVKKIILDETGKNITTDQFADQIGQWRDQGTPEIALMVGPADGWDQQMRGQGDLVLSFGKMTWPHKLAHVMAAEQIYRAISILSGTPYHRRSEQ